MRKEEIMERLIALLKKHYYGNVIALALFFILILFRIIPLLQESELIGVTLERYIIMISIITIPLALKLFARRLKKVPRPAETAIAVSVYKNASHLRLYTISAVTILNILLFGFSRNSNFMWITVVLFIIFLYCKPSYTELANLTEVPEENRATGEEEREESENRTEDEEAAGK
jgi:cobalamin synthase